MQYEKDLEDYIVKNLEPFTKYIKDLYYTWIVDETSLTSRLDGLTLKERENIVSELQQSDDFIFIGSQIKLGNEYADLVFSVNYDDERNFIVVELKNRNIQMKDLGQVSKYMNQLQLVDDYNDVLGIVLGTGYDTNVSHFIQSSFVNNIKFMKYDYELDYESNPSYSFTSDFIENFTFDDRLK